MSRLICSRISSVMELSGPHCPTRHYGDTLLNPHLSRSSALARGASGPGSRPVAAARRSRNAGEPSGRPIVSAALSAEIASAGGGRVEKVGESAPAAIDAAARRGRARRPGLRNAPARSTSASPRPARRAAPAPDSARHSAPPPSNAPRPSRPSQSATGRDGPVTRSASVDDRGVAPVRLAERPARRLLASGTRMRWTWLGIRQ